MSSDIERYLFNKLTAEKMGISYFTSLYYHLLTHHFLFISLFHFPYSLRFLFVFETSRKKPFDQLCPCKTTSLRSSVQSLGFVSTNPFPLLLLNFQGRTAILQWSSMHLYSSAMNPEWRLGKSMIPNRVRYAPVLPTAFSTTPHS